MVGRSEWSVKQGWYGNKGGLGEERGCGGKCVGGSGECVVGEV